MFEVLGYDKDNDVYFTYGEFEDRDKAIDNAVELTDLMNKGELETYSDEPVDWIEVYHNCGKSGTVIWTSY